MKIASFRNRDGAVRTGVVSGERVLDVSDWIADRPLSPQALHWHEANGTTAPAGGILRWLQSGPAKLDALATHAGERLAQRGTATEFLSEVRLLAPLPRPGKIIGVGRNYDDHAKELGSARMERPKLLFKVPSSVVGPGVAVPRPAGVTKLDFEVELAVVLGDFAKDVPPARALSHVAGYTIVNDLSAREFQFDRGPAQTSFAKSMDGFTPMGPWLVTADELPDPQALRLSCHVNGQLMQEGRTADMIFPVAELVAYVSRFMTLEPGDVIATGTPAGAGAFRTPPVYLAPGDRLSLAIDGIGTLDHRIAGPATGAAPS